MKPFRTLSTLMLLPLAATAQQLDPQDAWNHFVATNGAGWRAEWDAKTGTPSAIYGPGLRVAPSVDSADHASQLSAALLDRHSALLGRGASTFVLEAADQVRHIHYRVYKQQFRGVPVLGGRADVRLNQNGVVALFGASAVRVPAGFNIAPAVPAAVAKRAAIRAQLGGLANSSKRQPRLVIENRLIGEQAKSQPVLVWEVALDARPAQLLVGRAFVNATTGAVERWEDDVYHCACGATHVVGSTPHQGAHETRLARSLELRAKARAAVDMDAPPLTGKVMAWTRVGLGPTGALTNVPMANLLVTSSAGNAYTDANGNFSIPYSGTTAVSVTATLQGRHSRRVRVAQGTQLSSTVSVTPGTPATIQIGSSSMGQFDRSQTTTYYYTDKVNEWVRALVPTGTSQLNRLSGVNPRVNIASSCNAYYTSLTTNFYASSSTCNNTAYNTVITHEWGHGLDDVFGGISRTDGLSEGWADVIAILYSKQPIVGTNFRTNGGIVRTALNTLKYPTGSSSVHTQGQVWMGWVWDVRTFLATRLGTNAAQALTEKIVVPSIVADATNMAAQIREVFILDDDDGNLNNGTPNYKELEQASVKRTVPYPKRVNPNAGSYKLFGAGCKGTATGQGNCASNNSTGGSLTRTRRANEYAYIASTTRAISVTGFSIYSQSTGGSQTVRTAIYGDSGGRPSTTPLATGTVTIGATAGFYRSNLRANIPAGRFYVSIDHSAQTTYLSNLSSGTIGQAYWRRPPMGTGAFSLSGVVSRSSFIVHCGSDGIPRLTNDGVPELNQSFKVELNSARPNAASLLLIGTSNTKWGSTNLPFDLTNLGAKGCKLYTSLDAEIQFTTNSSGGYSQQFNVPNQASLFGVTFFNQFVVSDSANGFGLVLSNGGEGKIGKQ